MDDYPAQVLALAPRLRSSVSARISDADLVDDLVQECLTRLLAVEGRVSPEALAAYADAMARNLMVSHARVTERHRNLLWRLLDLRAPPDPADEASRREDFAALREALAGLDPEERQLLVDYELGESSTAALAAHAGSTPGAVAVRLSRARARLRLSYALTHTRTTLSSPHCGRVLLALAAADKRRQAALDAPSHLTNCPQCAALAPPLLQRRRGELLVLPLLLVAEKARGALRYVRNHPVHVAAGVTTAAGAAALAAVIATAGGNRPAPPRAARPVPVITAARLSIGNLDLFRAPAGPAIRMLLQGRQGQPVRATAVTVEQLAGADDAAGQPDDERFWIGAGDGRQLLVFLHINSEPPTPVDPDQHLSFTGTLQAVPADAASLDLQPGAATQVAGDGYYVEITKANAFHQQSAG